MIQSDQLKQVWKVLQLRLKERATPFVKSRFQGAVGAVGVFVALAAGAFAQTAPKIISQPANSTVTVGSQAMFSVTASAPDAISYQWSFAASGTGNFANLTDGNGISGSQTNTLSISNVGSGNEGKYKVTVTDTLNGQSLSTPSNVASLKEDQDWEFFTQAGNGTSSELDGTGSAAELAGPGAVGLDNEGDLIVADGAGHAVRKVTLAGVVTTLASTVTNQAEAVISTPAGVAVDQNDNIYFSDSGANTIDEIDHTGKFSVLAGTAGAAGSADGNGTSALFKGPTGLALDDNGNLYVSDTGNDTIRQIALGGSPVTVTTIAGTVGVAGSANGTSGTSFSQPSGIAFAPNGNPGSLYIADRLNNSIRQINLSNFQVSLLVGGPGTGSANGPPGVASFTNPTGIAYSSDGFIYVADTGSNAIREVDGNGNVTTLAGTANNPGNLDGAGTAARFKSPGGIAADSDGNVYVADTGNDEVRIGYSASNSGQQIFGVFEEISLDQTSASAPTPDPSQPFQANLQSPVPGTTVVTPVSGTVLLPFHPGSDGFEKDYTFNSLSTGSNSLEATIDGGYTFTLPGIGPEGLLESTDSFPSDPSPRIVAVTNGSWNPVTGDLVVDPTKDVTITITSYTDWNNNSNAIFEHMEFQLNGQQDNVSIDQELSSAFVAPTSNTPQTSYLIPANTLTNGNTYTGDLQFLTLTNFNPSSSITGVAGYGVQTNFTILAETPVAQDWEFFTQAGNGTAGYVDATGSAARFDAPGAVALDNEGDMIVADGANHAVRKVTLAGVVTTLANTTNLSKPAGIVVDQNDNIYVADAGSDTIDEISSQGAFSILAGSTGKSGSGNGTAAQALFNDPTGLALDNNGNLYIADTGNDTIRQITLNTSPIMVTTIAGTAGVTGAANGSSGTTFNHPEGVAFASNLNGGSLLVADTGNDTIRLIQVGQGNYQVSLYAGVVGAAGLADGQALSAEFNAPAGVACDGNGNLFVADKGNNAIREVNGDSGLVTTLGGVAGTPGLLDGAGNNAMFNGPGGIAVDNNGNLYIADTANNAVRIGYNTSNSGQPIIGVFKQLNFNQTLAGPPAPATGQLFQAMIQSPVPGSTYTPPGGSSNSLPFNPGNTDFEFDSSFYSSQGNLDSAFPDGTYSIALPGLATPVSLPLTGDLYPDNPAPEISSVTNATWLPGGGGVLEVIDPTKAVTFTLSTYANWGATSGAALEHMSFQLNGQSDGVNINQEAVSSNAFGETASPSPITSYTIPGGTLTAGNYYGGNIQFNTIITNSPTTVSGVSYNAISVYTVQTNFTLVARGPAPTIQNGNEPQSQSVNQGQQASFFVGNNGQTSGLTYQWQDEAPTGTNFTNLTDGNGITGSTTNNLSVNATSALNGYQFRVVVTNLFGSTTSNAVLLSVAGAVYTPYTFTTLAGSAGQSDNGNIVDGFGSSALLNELHGVGLDSNRTIYVTQDIPEAIRKISPAGQVSTLVNDSAGQLATSLMDDAEGEAVDANGNVYFVNFFSGTIAVAAPNGSVTFLAGSGNFVNSGDAVINGTGAAAGFGAAGQLNGGIAVDSSGNVYVADDWFNTIRKITPGGVVTTLAGSGIAGSPGAGSVDATGTNARFNRPTGVAVDGAGNVYVADSGNNTIRMVTPGGVVTTLAGTPGVSGYLDGNASSAQFNISQGNNIMGIAVDQAGSNVYLADSGNAAIRRLSGGQVTTLAGGLQAGTADGTGSAAQFSENIQGIAVDALGDLYVADANEGTIRKGIPATAVLASITGQPQPAGMNSNGSAQFSVTANASGPLAYQWQSQAFGSTDWINVADGGLFSGSATPTLSIHGDGIGTANGLAGTVFQCVVTDAAGSVTSNSAPLTVSFLSGIGLQSGNETVFAGEGVTFSASDSGNPEPAFQWQESTNGGANWTNLSNVNGVAGATTPTLHIGTTTTMMSGYEFKLVTTNTSGNSTSNTFTLTVNPVPGGNALAYDFTTLAGQAPVSLDGTGAAARFNAPFGAAVDSAGNVYVADNGGNTIRRITSTGVVTTIAGSPGVPGSADGTGSAARFSQPWGIAIDGTGNLYVSDAGNETIRKITPAVANGNTTWTVATLAGTAGVAGAVDATGLAAQFNDPSGVAVDSVGNVFVADANNDRIRQITPSGVVTTLAGGSIGSANGVGSAAQFHYPTGIAVFGSGNGEILYVSDSDSETIRKITLSGGVGTVSTFAGQLFNSGSSNGTGTAAQFSGPEGLAVDAGGNVYVADTYNDLIREITPSGAVTTLAGPSGISTPPGVALDGSGNVYVTNSFSDTVVKISSGNLTTLAGAPQTGSSNGTGGSARFSSPNGIAVDEAGNAYVADTANNTIRKVTPAGVVTTIGGVAGMAGYNDGIAASSQFNSPDGVAVDVAGNVYVADSGNDAIRMVSPAGVVTTIAGGNYGSADGTGSAAKFNYPYSLAVDVSGNLYVADTGNNTIRKITPAGAVTTLAGTAGVFGSSDGTGASAQFNTPYGVTVDGAGNVYVADSANTVIRKVTPGGVVTTLAGQAHDFGSSDGVGVAARFDYPIGLAADYAGDVYVADLDNDTIREITPSGAVTTLAGTPGQTSSTDGVGAAARFNGPYAIAVGGTGNLYVADTGNNTIRLGVLISVSTPVIPPTVATQPSGESILAGQDAGFSVGVSGTGPFTYQWQESTNSGGTWANLSDGNGFVGTATPTLGIAQAAAGTEEFQVIVTNGGGQATSTPATLTVTALPAGEVVAYDFTTLAGTAPGSADGTGTLARFNGPNAVATDASGNIFVADGTNDTIRKVTPQGVVTTFAGAAGIPGSVDGQGTAARFFGPGGLAFDGTGNLYVADYGNNTIRKITPGGLVTTLAGQAGVMGNANGSGSGAQFNGPVALAFDAKNDLFYVADQNNNMIREVTPSGLVTTIAGFAGVGNYGLYNGENGFGYQDGAGPQAQFANPAGVAVDSNGNVFVADSQNCLIREVVPTVTGWTVSTFAGNINTAGGGLVDGTGTGTDPAGDGSPEFNVPAGMAIDANNNLYVADQGNQAIRKITPAAAVTTIAGNTGVAGSADGPGATAQFNIPSDVAISQSGVLYVADDFNDTIRAISPGGVVSTLAGSPSPGSNDGADNVATFYSPHDVAVDSGGNLYVADSSNYTVRKITPEGQVTTLAGLAGQPGSTDGTGTAARFYAPFGVAVDLNGNVYVSDRFNGTIRKITPAGVVSTLAGLAGHLSNTPVDGTGSAARFKYPHGIAVDGNGNIYVSDIGNNTARMITPAGVVTTIAGASANFAQASGIAVDAAGNVYVSDVGENDIQKFTPTVVNGSLTWVGSPFAGTPGVAGSANGTGTQAEFNGADYLGIDGAGNLYVPEVDNNDVRRITPAGVVSTIAGTPEISGAVDGIGSDAEFNFPTGSAVDAAGNVYVADAGNNTIRKGVPTAVVPPSITTQPQGAIINAGQNTQFTVSATGTAPLTYQWQEFSLEASTWNNLTDGGDISGSATPTLSITGATAGQNGAEFQCVVSNGAATATSNTVVLSVEFLTGIELQSGSGSVIAGQSATFSAGVSGYPALNYQWQESTDGGKTWTNLSDGNGISGSLTDTLDLASTTTAMSGEEFQLLSANSEGVTTSTPVTLTVNALPAGDVVAYDFTTVAGKAGVTGYLDALGTAARFNGPVSTAVDSAGNLYVADSTNNVIRRIDTSGNVTTIAGEHGISGSVDGPGSAAQFNYPSGVAVDTVGNVYVVDAGNFTIRKITPSVLNGVTSWSVATLAGTVGSSGSSDGVGNSAQFSFSNEEINLAVDSSGNLYVPDTNNSTIRMVTPEGAVTTIAGAPGQVGSADGQAIVPNNPGSDAEFNHPTGVAVDGAGNVYIADQQNEKIRELTPDGMVATIAGNGQYGFVDGPGLTAEFESPSGIAVDGAGNLYVSDQDNSAIRMITPDGNVSTIGGSPDLSGSADGIGGAALFNSPTAVAVDGTGNLYVADSDNSTIRKGTPEAVLQTSLPSITTEPQDETVTVPQTATVSVAATGSGLVYQWQDSGNGGATWNNLSNGAGFSGTATATLTISPTALQEDGGLARVVVSNGVSSVTSNPALLTVNPGYGIAIQPTSQTVIGGQTVSFSVGVDGAAGATYQWQGSSDGGATWQNVPSSNASGQTTPTLTIVSATAANPSVEYQVIVTSASGTLTSTPATLTVNPLPSGDVIAYDFTTLAGTAGQGGNMDGTGGAAEFGNLTEVAVDSTGTIYGVDNGNNEIRKITPAGVVTTIAGGTYGSKDGIGTAAQFSGPVGITVDSLGNLYVADSGNYAIRRVTPVMVNGITTWVVTTLAGGTEGSKDGTGTDAQFAFSSICNPAVDSAGNVYVPDYGNQTIRKITPAGLVTTIAGKVGVIGNLNGSGSDALFNDPTGVAVDSAGNVYVGDWQNELIRKITPAGVVTTIAGNGVYSFRNGTGGDAEFTLPSALAVDGAGNIYFDDSAGTAIRKVTPAGVVTTLGGGSFLSYGYANGIGGLAQFNWFTDLAVDPAGNIYFADGNNVLRKGAPVAVSQAQLPTITTAPQAQTVTAGQNATFTVAASGPGIAYQWQVSNSDGSFWNDTTDGSGFSGSNTATLTVFSTTLSQSGDLFRVGISNQTTLVTNEPVALNVNPPFGISLQSGSESVIAGQGASFSVELNGSVSPTYQWQDSTDGKTWNNLTDGNGISGSATATLDIGAMPAATMSGEQFQVVVTDTPGTRTSAPVTLTILPLPTGDVVGYSLSILAGGGPNVAGSANGTGTAAQFDDPLGVAVDSAGNVTVADSLNQTLRTITPAGVVADGTQGETYAGYTPLGVAVDSQGNIYSTNYFDDAVQKATPAGEVTILAGGENGSADGTGGLAQFNFLDESANLAVDGSGNVYVPDSGNDTIRKITPAGVVTTIAGSAGQPGNSDGTGTAAQFDAPTGVALDSAGNLYVADQGNETIRKITPAGVVTTIAGNGQYGYVDGTASTAEFESPSGLAVDSVGNVFVADSDNNVIRKVTPDGFVTTILITASITNPNGGGGGAAGAPGVPLEGVKFNFPTSVAVGGNGTLYVADTGDNEIKWGIPTLVVEHGLPTIVTNPASLTAIAGQNAVFSVAANGSGLLYQWQVSTDGGVTFTNLMDGPLYSGSATATLTVLSTTTSQSGEEFQAVITNQYGPVTSSAATLTVDVVPAITTQPLSKTVLAGATVSFTVNGVGVPQPTLQWQISTDGGSTWTNLVNAKGISGATTGTLSIAGAGTSMSGDEFRLIATNAAGTATSNPATLMVNLVPGVTTQPGSQTVIVGAGASFTVVVAGSPAPTYLWQVSTDGGKTWNSLTDGNGISGSTTATLSITAATLAQSGDEYEVVATNGVGSVTSNPVTLTVNGSLGFTAQPAGETVLAGAGASFTVGIAGAPPPTLVWQESTDGGTTWANLADGGGISGSATATLSISAATLAQSGDEFEVVATNSSGTITSNSVRLIVNALPIITTQPAGATVLAGATATFTAASSGTPTPTYQWQESTNGGTTFANLTDGTGISGSATATLTIASATAAQSGEEFEVVATNAAGTATSSAATLTVNVLPTISSQPIREAVTAGQPAGFDVGVTGSPTPTVQWQISLNGGGSWTNLTNGSGFSGVTTPELKISSATVAMSGDEFRAVLTNTAGTVDSAAAGLSVTAIAPSITTQPASQSAVLNANATFSVVASGTAPLTYQWNFNGGPIAGATASSYSVSPVQSSNGGNYTVTVTNSGGSVTSNGVTLTVNPILPTITSPITASGVDGAIFNYLATTTASVATYSITSGTLPAGLSLNAKSGAISGTPTGTGTFDVTLTATNVTGSASTTLAITISPPPPVVTSPIAARGQVGASFTYAIQASNSPTTFGATGLPAGLSVSSAGVISGTPTQAGAFTVTLSAGNGTGTTSQTLQLVIAAAANAPVYTGATQISGRENKSFSFTPNFGSGITGYALVNVSAATTSVLPPGLELDPTEGTISGTPTQTGTFVIAVQATSAGGSTTQTLTITINAPPLAPAINSASTATATVGAAFAFTVTSTSAASTYSATGLPPGLTISSSGSISGTPTASGTYNVSVTPTLAGVGSGAASILQISVSPALASPVITSAAGISGQVNASFAYQVTASGSPTGFVVTSGSLPLGLTLNTSTGAITGTPTQAGSAQVWIAASNASGQGLALEVTFTISPAPATPTITSNTTVTGQVGQPFSYVIAASNNPTSFAASGLSSGLALNTATGVISGLPGAATAQPISVTLTASNANGSGSAATLLLSINPAPATPVIISAISATGQAGTAFSYQIAASYSPTSFSALGLPPGLSVNPTSGAITGTPTQAGPFDVSLAAANSSGLGASTTLVLTVTAAPAAPIIISSASDSAQVGAAYSYTISAAPGPITTYNVTGTLPLGLALDTSTGVLSGTPAESGVFVVDFTATSGAGASEPQSFVLVVAPAEGVPDITSSLSEAATVGAAFSYAITASNVPASTPFPPSVTLDAVDLPPGLAVNPSTGVISGTPTQVGTYTVGLTGQNASGSGSTAYLTITVGAAASAPVVNSAAAAQAQVGQPFAYTIAATNNPTSYLVLNAPSWMTVNTQTGVLGGTPVSPVTVAVQLEAINAAGTSQPLTLTVSVAAILGTPVITSGQSQTGEVGTVLTYDITATNSPTSYVATGLPAGLSLNVTTGVISGTPTASGTYEVTLTASNLNITGQGGDSNPVTLTLTINSTDAIDL